MNLIQSILIANRGEIACRIIRTCRRLGIRSIAVYSEVDKQALFVKMADVALALGGVQASESYLKQDKILEAAKQTKADAIHPGYGFLAENAGFAQKCKAAGLIFIGPNPQAIEAMGSKSAAKTIMAGHDVPIIPGYQGEDQSKERLIAEAKKIGFPLLLKAVAGGGGKGMRIVEEESQLESGIEAACREAINAFGNGELIIEKYFPSARHIEFQIFGDQQGNAIHLLERECTIQRRYQKIVEESPSPVLSPELRAKMGEAAVKAAKAIHYDNAGTVEFIYTKDGNFYFLEVNTRLQVEHPVTEAITGLDLVELQITVAEGKALPIQQEQVRACGYAIECRLYAENPLNQFFPETGTVLYWNCPELEGLRYDTGIESGSVVDVYYDPMLAKVVAHGANRQQALRRMDYALRRLACLGLITNKEFLVQLLRNGHFQKGYYDTHFIQNYFDFDWLAKTDKQQVYRAAIALLLYRWQAREISRKIVPDLSSGWRNIFYQNQQESYFREEQGAIDLTYRYQNGAFGIEIDEQSYTAELVSRSDNSITVIINGLRQTFSVAASGEDYYIQDLDCGQLQFSLQPRFPEIEDEKVKGGYTAPMPGEILEVLVEAGQKVQEGDSLLVLCSMKMENTISAQEDGIIKEVFVTRGENIEAGVLLLKIQDIES